MHTSFAKRCAILKGLRERARLATAEFYQKPGVMPPTLAPCIIVKAIGDNNFLLIERDTGKKVAERIGHNNATGHAQELEAKAAQSSIKHFGKCPAQLGITHRRNTVRVCLFRKSSVRPYRSPKCRWT